MKLVVPMSGLGERFKNAGYSVPKPMIPVFNKPMVVHVLDCFPGVESVAFIVNAEHDREFDVIKTLKKYFSHAGDGIEYYPIVGHKLGPVKAILQAEEEYSFVRKDKEVVVNYCDFWQLWNFYEFRNFVDERRPDGAVVCWTGFHPHMLNNTKYAYVKTEGDAVVEIREKSSFTDDPMSELASTGTYYFKSGNLMLESMREQVDRGLQVNGEYYASLPLQVMVEKGLDVRAFEVEKFVAWGNPQDYEEFTYNAEALKRKRTSRTRCEVDTTLLPMGGLGTRFSERGYTVPKALIRVDGRHMFENALDALPGSKRTVLVTVKGAGDAIVAASPDYEHCVLDEPTDGQARTCYLALKRLGVSSGSLVVGACDHANVLDFEAPDADFGVFAARGYPTGTKRPSSYGWIDADAAGHIKRVVVKEKLSDPTTDWLLTGAFWFRDASVFLEAAEREFEKNDRVNNEFYVDTLVNHAVALGYSGRVIRVDYFVPWGTPDELDTYLFWQGLFERWRPWHEVERS